MKPLIERLAEIQRSLNAPKNQRNNFGNYNYRSCEDILQAVKPILNGLVITVTDDIFAAGDRVYVKATASITDGENTVSTTAFAREAMTKKGMDDSQITGSTSSYARKYALNGLLLIDDNKDADSMDNRQTANNTAPAQQVQKPVIPNPQDVIKAIVAAPDVASVNRYVATARERGVNDAGMGSIQEAAMEKISQLGG